jgi:hypothetical protein
MSNVFNNSQDSPPEIELVSILKTMDVPRRRCELSKSNLRWLARNIAVRNREHPQFEDAFNLIKLLLKKGIKVQ